LYESSVKGEEECVIAYALLLVLNNEWVQIRSLSYFSSYEDSVL
jgi:hypothetical protein